MLDVVEAHIMLFAETQVFRYLQQGHHNASFPSRHFNPTPPPFAALPTDSKQHVY